MCLPFVFGGQLTRLIFPCFPCNILVECIIFDSVAAISSFKQQVKGLQDIHHSIEMLVRLLCAVPGWSEKNVQVQQQVIEVITYMASTAKKFPKKCVVLCLLAEFLF
ncbi:hypothetical protein FF1_041920 [Malus domestica]